MKKTELPIGTIVKVTKNGRGYIAVTSDGTDITDKIAGYALKNAFKQNKALQLHQTKTGATQWRQVFLMEYEKATKGELVMSDNLHITSKQSSEMSQEEIIHFIDSSNSIKPKKLKIPETWWKFAVRTVLRAGNLLVVGPSGCGKTLLSSALKLAFGKVEEKTYFYINLGATQDPRSTLIGNTHFDKEKGTFVSLSYFAQAIQIPNAIILLDEASRAHPEAHNILMTVLDPTQRYLRVDERVDSATIRVANGVSFILTANVGSEYTATRVMDRALLDRCIMFEMSPLDKDSEYENLSETFPGLSQATISALTEVADHTRMDAKNDIPKLNTIISTRMIEQMAALIQDGFSFEESAEVCVFPYFDPAGGEDSPRSNMKKVIQKYLPNEYKNKSAPFTAPPVNKTSDPLWAP